MCLCSSGQKKVDHKVIKDFSCQFLRHNTKVGPFLTTSNKKVAQQFLSTATPQKSGQSTHNRLGDTICLLFVTIGAEPFSMPFVRTYSLIATIHLTKD